MALLVGVTAWAPIGVGAQEPEKAPPKEIIEKDVDGKEWITPDVGAAEEEEEEDAIGDVDEVVIEYGASPDTEQDQVTDAEGKEIEDTPTPVVSKAVQVQDPNELEPGADRETGVQGQVVSRKPKKVLPDAPVLAKGKGDGKLRSTITDERGRYRLYLPPGKYTLRSYYDLYHGARWDDIAVTRGKFSRINFILDPISEKDAGVEEQEVVYLADTSSEAAQLNLRKEAVGVQDAISAEEIKRAGDSTATGAVARVVGVTIDEEGRLIIRGLPDRYNQILLNGVPIPGVDPDIPSVKLDIFPTDIVSNLSVVKNPRPDLPGNFAGGLLNIETSNYPLEQMVKAGVSIGGNSLSTFRQMPTYPGGKRDWLGFDDGARAVPSSLGGQRLDTGRAGNRYRTNDQVSQVGRGFSDVWNPRTKLAIPELGIKVSAGNSGEIGKKRRNAGYLVSFLYDYEESIETGFNKRYTYDENGNASILLRDFDYKEGKQEVLWGTFGSGFLQINADNQLNVTTMFNRTSDDHTIVQLGGEQNDDFIPLTANSFNFIGRSIFFNQLTGDHQNLKNSKVRLRWNAAVSNGKRDEPDRRLILQQVESQTVTGASRFFSDLKQLTVGGKTSVRFPVYKAFDSTAYVKVGFDSGYTDREFNARRFTQQGRGGAPLIGDPEDLLGPNGLGPVSTIREVTRPNDSYVASNFLVGGYAQLETPIAPRLQFLGLLRFEFFRQEVTSDSPFSDDEVEAEGTDRRDKDPMPSANLSIQINDRMFVKIGYGMTVIRPAIRELAPFDYLDFLRGWLVAGNPDLQRTRIQNAEARYEFYFGDTDLFAVTAFGKYFKNPIEFVILSQVNGNASFRNADSAWLVGGEVELRLGFGRLHEKLEKFYFLGNVAVMGSQTTLPSDQQIAGRLQRRLFKQSPFVTNLSLRFDDPDSGVMVGLVYNAFGPRIVEAGSPQGGDVIAPDVFEQTQHILDLISTWRVSPHVKVGLKWKNIAFARRRYKQGDELTFLENRGTSVSIAAEYIY
ncbi:MAG: carboxypeptidase regulatory-like domain-containing protein [Deltaproteobacteria bacterium]|nr:carboxypeptidase regulatory-like domain-containing protein [Deltaproteobacteria bacterium]